MEVDSKPILKKRALKERSKKPGHVFAKRKKTILHSKVDVPSNFAIPEEKMDFEYPTKNSPSKMAAASAHTETYSDEELKIAESLRKQIEFYFGESNLHKDKHFRNLLNQSS